MIRRVPLPADSLLATHADGPAGDRGAYTDCFAVDVDQSASSDAFARYTYLFFDSWLFRMERRILSLAGKALTGRADAVALALGQEDRFAAWQVEARRDTELLMVVPGTAICTWLRMDIADDAATLLFGSAIMPADDTAANPRPGWAYRATFWAHQIYSRALLTAAARDWTAGKTLPE